MVHIRRGGMSVKDWRGGHRPGVASTSKRFFRVPRNVLADTAYHDDALVIIVKYELRR